MTPAVSSSALHSLPVIFSHLHCTDTVSKACSLSVTLKRLGLLNVCSGLGVLRFVEAENVFKIGKCPSEIKDAAVVMMILQHVLIIFSMFTVSLNTNTTYCYYQMNPLTEVFNTTTPLPVQQIPNTDHILLVESKLVPVNLKPKAEPIKFSPNKEYTVQTMDKWRKTIL